MEAKEGLLTASLLISNFNTSNFRSKKLEVKVGSKKSEVRNKKLEVGK